MADTDATERDTEPPPLPPHGRPPAQKITAPRLACRACRSLTTTRTLSLYAGQCYECFAAQCLNTPISGREDLEKSTDPKAWAWRLRARELAGERLPIGEAAMWRGALAKELRTMAGDLAAP
jgi:hypothetical protein